MKVSIQFTRYFTSSDTTHALSDSSTAPQPLTIYSPTSITFSCTSSNDISYTGSLTGCTVTVTNIDNAYMTPPAGTISFSNGPSDFTGSLCTLTGSGDSSSCTFTYNAKPDDEGVYSITATFASIDTTHLGSGPTSAFALTVYTATTVSIACSSPATIGVSNSCTVTVANVDSSYSMAATGTITFTGVPSGFPNSCVLSSGKCTFSWTPSSGSQGSYTIAASYGGDTTHTSSSGSESLSVINGTTSTAISCIPSPVIAGSQTICTATVTDTGSGTPITPTGMVTFSTSSSGSFSSSTCVLSQVSLGVADCLVIYTPAPGSEGTHIIGASYPGDSQHLGSSHQFLLEVETNVSITMACNTPTVVGASETCKVRATNVDTSFPILPSGTLAFSTVPAGFPPSCTLSSSASCTFTFTPSPGSEGQLHSNRFVRRRLNPCLWHRLQYHDYDSSDH